MGAECPMLAERLLGFYPTRKPSAGKGCRNSMLRVAGAWSQSSNCSGSRITTMRFSSVGLTGR